MKSITIHNLDDSLYLLIREKSKKQGTSLNKMVQILLRQALGLNSKPIYDNSDCFLDLFGVWSPKDVEDFDKGIQEFSEINELDWK